jgi:flagellar biosynthesis protein FlhB
MNEPSSLASSLEALSGILLRCFVIGVVFILFWFFFFQFSGDMGYEIQAKLFKITRHEYDLLNYCGMAFVKVCNFLFFLFPYIAIRLVITRRKDNVHVR